MMPVKMVMTVIIHMKNNLLGIPKLLLFKGVRLPFFPLLENFEFGSRKLEPSYHP